MGVDTNLFFPFVNARTLVGTAPVKITLPARGESLQVTVGAGADVLIVFGNENVATVTQANSVEYFQSSREVHDWPEGITHASVIAATGSVYVTFSSGFGE
jgi:hypothetical protein